MTDTPKTTHTEDWEKEFKRLRKDSEHSAKAYGHYSSWEKQNEAIKHFLRETRTAAREAAIREALDALPKEEEPAKRLNTFKEGFKSGWNLHSEHSRTAITTLLGKEQV